VGHSGGWIECWGGMVIRMSSRGGSSRAVHGFAFGRGSSASPCCAMASRLRLFYENDIRFLHQFRGCRLKVTGGWLADWSTSRTRRKPLAEVLAMRGFSGATIDDGARRSGDQSSARPRCVPIQRRTVCASARGYRRLQLSIVCGLVERGGGHGRVAVAKIGLKAPRRHQAPQEQDRGVASEGMI